MWSAQAGKSLGQGGRYCRLAIRVSRRERLDEVLRLVHRPEHAVRPPRTKPHIRAQEVDAVARQKESVLPPNRATHHRRRASWSPWPSTVSPSSRWFG